MGVSNWRLANTVSRLGQLGVVSGTALDSLFTRRLADGDKGGNMRRGLNAFPFPEMARRVWQEYFVERTERTRSMRLVRVSAGNGKVWLVGLPY